MNFASRVECNRCQTRECNRPSAIPPLRLATVPFEMIISLATPERARLLLSAHHLPHPSLDIQPSQRRLFLHVVENYSGHLLEFTATLGRGHHRTRGTGFALISSEKHSYRLTSSRHSLAHELLIVLPFSYK